MKNKNQNRETYSTYLQNLADELKFLWQDAHSTLESNIKERKLQQYWEMYRFYRQQREHYALLFS